MRLARLFPFFRFIHDCPQFFHIAFYRKSRIGRAFRRASQSVNVFSINYMEASH